MANANGGATAGSSGSTSNSSPSMLFENENPIDIVLVLLHQYPQIETWLQSMEYHGTVTTSRTHAVQFLTSLMDSQPQFTQLIKLIQGQLKQRRASGVPDPSTQAAGGRLGGDRSGNAAGGSGGAFNQHRDGVGGHGVIGNVQSGSGSGGDHERGSGSGHASDGDKKKRRKSGSKKGKSRKDRDRKKKSKRSSKKGSSSKKSSKRKKRKSKDEHHHHNGSHRDRVMVEGNDESDYAPSSSASRRSTPSRSRPKKRRKPSRRKQRRHSDEEPEYSGQETEESGHSAMDSGESDDYNPAVNIDNIGSRKSDRKRRPKKRSLNEMSNGAYAVSRKKRQKTGHGAANGVGTGSVRRRGTNLAQYISPAPIHWKVQSVEDVGGDGQRGQFKIRMTVQRHPIKEALIRMGSKSFTVEDMLDTLTAVEAESEYEVEVKRTKPARKRLTEELMVIRGCYRVLDEDDGVRKKRYHGDGSGSDYEDPAVGDKRKRGDVEFSAAEFLKFNAKNMCASGQDSSDDTCHICGKCGELVLCDGCPHAFHLLCVGLSAVPEDQWFCRECERKKGGGGGDGQSELNGGQHSTEIHDGQNGDVEMDGATESAIGGHKADDGSAGTDGRRMLSAIFMANKGDGRISDMTEINNAVHAATTNPAEPQDQQIQHHQRHEEGQHDERPQEEVLEQSRQQQQEEAMRTESQQKEEDLQRQSDVPVESTENVVDDGFPEPDIDVVVEETSNLDDIEMNSAAEPQQELPSPDAPDSGVDRDTEQHVEQSSAPQMDQQMEAPVEPQSELHSEPQSEPHPEPHTEPHSEPQTELQIESVPEPHTDPVAEPQREVHSEPLADSLPEPPSEASLVQAAFEAVVSNPMPSEHQEVSAEKEQAPQSMADAVPAVPEIAMTNECPTEIPNHFETEKAETQIPTEMEMERETERGCPSQPMTEPQSDSMAMHRDEDESMDRVLEQEVKPTAEEVATHPVSNGTEFELKEDGQSVPSPDTKMSCGPSDTGDDLSMNNEEENNTDTDNTENIQVEANKHLEVEAVSMEQGERDAVALSTKMQDFSKLNGMDIEEKETEQDDGLSGSEANGGAILTGSQEY